MSSQSERQRVGVLGGMGPEATIHLMARVVDMTTAADDCDHVSMIVDNNTVVPSRIKALIEKTGDDPGPVLAEMARGLETCGADALAMPCNTAHHYAAVIEAAVDIPFLNMVELAVARVNAMNLANRRVGILASPAVRSTQIFDRAFNAQQLETLYPSDQNRMLNAIRLVKIDSNNATARQVLADAADELTRSGADCLLIACSEFSIIADAVPSSYSCYDSIDILAEAVIKFAGAEFHGHHPEQPGNNSREALRQKRA